MSAKLGPFELLEQIGKGGMAAVFRAYDPSRECEIALKLLDEEVSQQNSQFGESFMREAQIAASLNHPNIVEIYSVGEVDGVFFVAMELLKGRSLADILRDDGPLDQAAALGLGIQISSALHVAYVNRVTHGNIKPQNIFITTDGTAKLLDFGLAKMASLETFTDSESGVWGSAYYIAPESVGRNTEDMGGDIDSLGAAAFHARLAALCKNAMLSDIYSLGATLFHALAGRPPFDANSAEELTLKRSNEIAPSLRKINPRISAGTEQIVARMLSKNAFQRHQDYGTLIGELREPGSKSAGRHAPAARTAVPGAAAGISMASLKSKPLVLILAGAGALLILGVLIFFLIPHNKKAGSPAVVGTTPAPNSTPVPVAAATSAPTATPDPNATPAIPPSAVECFSFAANDSSENFIDPRFQSEQTNATGITRGKGLGVFPGTKGSLRSVASDNSYGANLDGAIAKKQYYEFRITPLPGWKLSLKKLEFYAYFQNAGASSDPRGAGITYSTDGTNFSNGIVAAGKASANPSTKFTVDLGGQASLQNTDSTVTLRIYLFGNADREYSGIGRAPEDTKPQPVDDIILTGAAN
jgi:serine/threonine protein kinase